MAEAKSNSDRQGGGAAQRQAKPHVSRGPSRLLGFAFGWLGFSSGIGRYLFWLTLLFLVGAIGYLAYNLYGIYSRPVGSFFHPTTTCANCHNAPSQNARLYLAVDGQERADEVTVEKDAGEYVEIDFHFAGIRGDPQRFTGVGAAIEVPNDPVWRVTAGSLRRPSNWSETSSDEARVWSPAWDRAANGRSSTGVRWQASSDKPNLFYADFSASKWAVPKFAAAANDLGAASTADQDGLADRMGLDAIVSIPSNAKPGIYKITVMAIGHDPDGKRVNATRAITVKVSEALPFSLAVERGRRIYTGVCYDCHGLQGDKLGQKDVRLYSKELFTRWDDAGLAMLVLEGRRDMPPLGKEKGGPLTPQDAKAVVYYLRAMAGVPPSTLTVESTERASGGGIVSSQGVTEAVRIIPGGTPTPQQPGQNAVSGPAKTPSPAQPKSVRVPAVPHDTGTLKECLFCHSSNGLKPVPSTHERRTEETCLDCHKSSGPQGGAPRIGHKLERREWCGACHLIGAGPRPLPLSHRTRSEQTCLICHVPPPTAKHDIDPMQTVNCRECHAKLPPSHQKRADDSCVQCHSGPIVLPEEITAWAAARRYAQPKVLPQLILSPTPSAPKQYDRPPDVPHPTGVATSDFTNCLTCHGAGGIRPVPVTHRNRLQMTCLGCHKVNAPDRGIPPMAHRVGSHEMCLSCHGPDSGFKAVSATHATRGEDTCTLCHKPPPRAKHTFGANTSGCFVCHHSLSTPHRARGENCVRCHDPAPPAPPTPASPPPNVTEPSQPSE